MNVGKLIYNLIRSVCIEHITLEIEFSYAEKVEKILKPILQIG